GTFVAQCRAKSMNHSCRVRNAGPRSRPYAIVLVRACDVVSRELELAWDATRIDAPIAARIRPPTSAGSRRPQPGSARQRLRERLVIGLGAFELYPVAGPGHESHPSEVGRPGERGRQPVLEASIQDVFFAPDAEHRTADVGQRAQHDVGSR